MNSEVDSAPGPSEPKNTDSSPQKRPAESSGESTESKRIKASVQNLRTRGSSEEPGPSELREYESERIKDKEELKKLLRDLLEPDCHALDNVDLVHDLLEVMRCHHFVVTAKDPYALDHSKFVLDIRPGASAADVLISYLMHRSDLKEAQNIVEALKAANEVVEEEGEEQDVDDEEEKEDVNEEDVEEPGVPGEEDPKKLLEEEERFAEQEFQEVLVHVGKGTDHDLDERLNKKWHLMTVMTNEKFDYTKLAQYIKMYVEPEDPLIRPLKINAFVKNVLFGYTKEHYNEIMADPVGMSLTPHGRKIFWRMVKFMLWDKERIEDSLFLSNESKRTSKRDPNKNARRAFTDEEKKVYDDVFAKNPNPSIKQQWQAALKANNGLDRARVAFKTRKTKRLREARAREQQDVLERAPGTSGIQYN